MASLFRRAGSPFWWLRHRVDGKWKNESTGLRFEDERETAEADLIRAKWSVKETRESGGKGTNGYSWGWVDQWLTGHCKSPRTLAAYKLHWRHIQHWIVYAGIHLPQDIKYQHGQEYVSWRTGRVANKKVCSLNNALLEVKLLGQVLRQCMLRGEIAVNPIQKLGIKKNESEEKRELSDAEIQRCLAAFEEVGEDGKPIEPEWMRLAFLIALHTGCRLRETCLQMHGVDFERRSITFATPKGGRSKAFTRPMPEALVPVLEKLKHRTVSHEMPFQPSRCFQNFFQRLGIQGVSFHCLRVTYVTRLHRAGVPLSAAMRLVNHSSEVVHRIYTKLNVEDVRAYADVPLFSTTPKNSTAESDSPPGETPHLPTTAAP